MKTKNAAARAAQISRLDTLKAHTLKTQRTNAFGNPDTIICVRDVRYVDISSKKPAIAHTRISYVPYVCILNLTSLMKYLSVFQNYHASLKELGGIILEDLTKKLKPHSLSLSLEVTQSVDLHYLSPELEGEE